MTNKDKFLLEKAYMSISKAVPSVPSDKEEIVLNSNEEENQDMYDTEEWNHNEEECWDDEGEETEHDFEFVTKKENSDEDSEEDCGCNQGCACEDYEEVSEEEDMNISNLSSIRESLMKISLFCSRGGNLQPWQVQKIAVCMDNLSEVARRLR